MKRLTLMLSLLGLAAAVTAVGGGPRDTSRGFSKPTIMAGARNGNDAEKPRIAEAYGKLPLSFEANDGQTDRSVKFISRGAGYALFVTPDEAVLALSKPQQNAGTADPSRRVAQPEKTTQAILRIKLAGGNSKARAIGVEEQAGTSNYFLGDDRTKWRTNVPNYSKVKLQDVYPGIDQVYYGNQRQLEEDFVVAPGADPAAIAMKIGGADKVSIADGELVLAVEGGEVRLRKPTIYQETAEGRREVAGGYALRGNVEVTFEVAAFDRSQPLIIDPSVSFAYSTYLGGSTGEVGYGISFDSSGNAYVTGYTASTDFPTTTGAYQTANHGSYNTFVTKLNSTGTALVYSTYLGGTYEDFGQGIAVDGSGNAYVTGYTLSTNFPTTAGAYQTAKLGEINSFVTKLNPTGTALLYSTYLGGSYFDQGFCNAVDDSGNAYVTGGTASTDFPTTTGTYQTAKHGPNDNAFVTKLNSTGTALLYSTYLGGNYQDIGYGIAVDGSGNAYVTGYAASTNFPTTAGAFQTALRGSENAFVTRLNPTGTALLYSTYLGGSSDDIGQGIAVDGSGNVYITGYAASTNFPTTTGAFQTALRGSENAFVTRLNPTGTALLYSTYLGGSLYDGGKGIAVDGSGNAYVAGITQSGDFPTTAGAYQTANRSPFGNAFVTKLNSTGTALLYSTYLGGSFFDIGQGIAVDGSGNVYITGYTYSSNFPTTTGAYQSVNHGYPNAFVTKFTGVVIVSIDVDPGNDPPTINAQSQGKIPVAILSNVTFNAPAQVKVSSLTFGHTGNEASLAFCSGAEDVNGDGIPDLVCHFNNPQTGFLDTDTVATLKGTTNGGSSFMGTDTIVVIH